MFEKNLPIVRDPVVDPRRSRIAGQSSAARASATWDANGWVREFGVDGENSIGKSDARGFAPASTTIAATQGAAKVFS